MPKTTAGIELALTPTGLIDIKKVGDRIKQVGTKGIKAARTVTNGFKRVRKVVGRVTKTFTGFIKKLASLKTAVVGLVAAAGIIAIGTSFVKVAADFETGMANVSTLVDTAVVDMGRLKSGILDLSAETGRTAKDLAAAEFQVISSGIKAADSLTVLEASTKAAIAGQADLSSTVDAVTGFLNVYGLGADQASRVTDIMFETMKRGKVTFEQLSGSIGTVLSPAKSLGVSMEDLGAVLSTATRGNIDINTATTALRTLLFSILSPTSEATEKAEELGLAWGANALSTKGLIPFLAELREKTGGNAESMRALIPESRALNLALSVTGEQFQGLIDDQEGIEGAFGATEEAFDKQAGTFNEGLARLTTKFERIKITIGDELGPVISDFLDLDILPLVDDFQAWAEVNSGVIADGLDLFFIDVGKALRAIDFKVAFEFAKDLAKSFFEIGKEVGKIILATGSWIKKNKGLIESKLDTFTKTVTDTLKNFDVEDFFTKVEKFFTTIDNILDRIDNGITAVKENFNFFVTEPISKIINFASLPRRAGEAFSEFLFGGDGSAFEQATSPASRSFNNFVPVPATSGSQKSSSQSVSVGITVNQQPGEDSGQLARRIKDEFVRLKEKEV